jgi:hypothetical protein
VRELVRAGATDGVVTSRQEMPIFFGYFAENEPCVWYATQVEAMDECYPETLAFVRLLNKLVRVCSSPGEAPPCGFQGPFSIPC